MGALLGLGAVNRAALTEHVGLARCDHLAGVISAIETKWDEKHMG